MQFVILLYAVMAHMVDESLCDDNAKRLFDDLMSSYNHFRRPGHHKEILQIHMKMRLSQIIDVVSTRCFILQKLTAEV